MSDGLSERQATALIAAAKAATEIGLPPNRHTTINLARLGVPNDRGAEAVTRLTKLLREWLAKRGRATAFLWVREEGGVGHHLHLLWHLPPGTKLRQQMKTWAMLLTGGRVPAGAIKTRTVRGHHDAEGDLYRENLGALLAYMLKGCDTITARALGLKRAGEGGYIVGKRSGASANVGPSARRQLSANKLKRRKLTC